MSDNEERPVGGRPEQMRYTRPSVPGPGRNIGSTVLSKQGGLLKAVLKLRDTEYNYRKLRQNTTRLLTLHPRRDDSNDIWAQLTEVPFEELGTAKARYEALSYHWGDGEANLPVRIYNSEPPSTNSADFADVARSAARNPARVKEAENMPQQYRILYVKPNLFEALYHLRHNGGPINVWVDAICINQQDRAEKDAQVARMNELYSKASQVLIWLGPGDESTKRAMDFLYDILDLDKVKKLIKDLTKVSLWQDLMHLIRSSWFSRRWVIQELALAQNASVHCGDKSVHWNDLRDAISLFSDNFDAIRTLFKRSADFDHDFNALGEISPLPATRLIDTINNVFKKRESAKSYEREPIQGLEYLVSTLSAFDTSDPRDTIFAFRNIAKETYRAQESGDREQSPVLPNYSRDLFTVYRDFVKWVVERSGSIDILCRQWAIPELSRPPLNYPDLVLVKLPSWIQTVPDIGRSDTATNSRLHGDSFVGQPGYGSYNTCNGRVAKVRFADEVATSQPSTRSNTNQTQTTAGPSTKDSLIPMAFADEQTRGQDGGDWTNIRKRRKVIDSVTSAPTGEGSMSDSCVVDDTPAMATGHESSLPPTKPSLMPDELQEAVQNDTGGEDFSNKRKRSNDAPLLKPIAVPDGYTLQRILPNDDGSSMPDSPTNTEDDLPGLAQLRKDCRDASIYIEGLQIGELTYVTDPIPDGVIPARALDKLWDEKERRVPVPDKVWRTLVAERSADGRQPLVTDSRACEYIVTHGTPNGHINTKDLLTQTKPEIVRTYLKRVQSVIWDRCFLEIDTHSRYHGKLHGFGRSRTKTGDGQHKRQLLLHGFGPSRVREKDVLCILFGCSVPCILRPHFDEKIGIFYTLIGEAFVYGIMDGEAIASLGDAEIETDKKEFRIL
ncbi:hypothetical protein LTR27_012824 [Elasticomyces elasticus]|nr:hypothetical protein LTR27_012824 [Elasticomyces elasticus]